MVIWNLNIEIETSGVEVIIVDTVGKDAKKIQKYIQDQLKEDELSEQLTLDLNYQFMGNK